MRSLHLLQLQDASASIPDYFAGKTIAITGSTGFLGQLLIEKLLRSCPNIKKIYVLLRSKKDVSSKERLNQIVNLPVSIIELHTKPFSLSF